MKNENECSKVAQKIVDLTGYGQALHVNDILPDLKELVTTAVAKRELEIAEEVEKKSFRGFAPYEQDYLIKKEDVLSILKH